VAGKSRREKVGPLSSCFYLLLGKGCSAFLKKEKKKVATV